MNCSVQARIRLDHESHYRAFEKNNRAHREITERSSPLENAAETAPTTVGTDVGWLGMFRLYTAIFIQHQRAIMKAKQHQYCSSCKSPEELERRQRSRRASLVVTYAHRKRDREKENIVLRVIGIFVCVCMCKDCV